MPLLKVNLSPSTNRIEKGCDRFAPHQRVPITFPDICYTALFNPYVQFAKILFAIKELDYLVSGNRKTEFKYLK